MHALLVCVSGAALLHAAPADPTAVATATQAAAGNLAALAADVRDSDPLVRLRAVETLSGLDTPPSRQALMEARKDPEQRVRMAALAALVRLRAPEFRPVILEALYEGDEAVRLAAIPWVVEVKPRAVTPPLCGLLQDPASSAAIRLAAAKALGQLREETGIPALTHILNAADLPPAVTDAVRIEAARSLGILGGTFAIDELLTAAETGPAAVRPEAVVALAPYAALPRPGARIIALACKADPETRRRFLAAATASGRATETVFRAFENDPDLAVRQAAAFGLGRLREPTPTTTAPTPIR